MTAFRFVTPDPSKVFTIGRKSENDLCFPKDLFVSRFHAELECKDGEWTIRSITQNSETRLNGNKIDTAKLEDGDVIYISAQKLRVNIRGGVLTLLVQPINEEAESTELDGRWKTIEFHSEEKHEIASVKAKIEEGMARVQFSSKVVDEKGKSLRSVEIPQNEGCRLPWCEIWFRDNSLHIQDVPCGFSVKAEKLDVFAGKKCLLSDVNFELPAGEILAIIGRSGQGKSTLLRLLSGKHTKGSESSVTIGGADYRSDAVRKRITILEQDPDLRPDLTVDETLLHGAKVSLSKEEFKTSAEGRREKFCELFGLSHLRKSRIKELSGGELRRVALAQELMGNPGLILLDEPLSGLDPYNSKILCNHLKQLSFLGHTVILTTHSYEALRIANKVLVLHQGEQGFFGSPQGAYNYFNSNDPEAILSGLNDETGTRWKESQTESSLSEQQTLRPLFPQRKTTAGFFQYLSLAWKSFCRDKGKLAAILLQPIVIGFLLSQIFTKQSSLWTIAFALILCANWFALSLSVRTIVQEKNILLNELRKGIHSYSILSAKILLPLLVSFLQVMICFGFTAYNTPITNNVPLTCGIFALTVLPAVAIGLLVSSVSKNAGQANAFLPLLIIPQVALAGALVPLDQMQDIGRGLSYAIWSRYNQSSLLGNFLQDGTALYNYFAPLGLAIVFYIVSITILHLSKKAK